MDNYKIVKYLSQRDPAWAAQRLGISNLTLGRYGCTSVCLSMLSDYFDNYMSPPEIASHKNWYTKGGLIVWDKLDFPKMKFVERVRIRADNKIKESLLKINTAVMLEVNNGQHWVVALRKAMFGNDYLVLDPWSGQKCWAIKKYHNITGSAHFQVR